MLTSRNRKPPLNDQNIKKSKKMIVTSIICAFILVIFIIILITVIIPKNKNNKAMILLDEGNYDSAYALLEEVGNYETVASNKYDRAIKLIDSGEYEAAYFLLNGLEYKDSDQKLQGIIPQYKEILLGKANVGDTIYFGSYEQDNNTSNGKEGIEWLVLDKENEKILVISNYALECLKFNELLSDAAWETCTLRSWLNETFLNSAFKTAEQDMLVTANIATDDNPMSSTNQKSIMNDTIFILSITEATNYFDTDESRVCAPTAFAKSKGAYTTLRSKTKNDEASCCWWLRTPGKNQKGTTYVANNGNIQALGSAANYENYTVRPALWINLDY